MRRFSVWNGTAIGSQYRDLRDLRDAVYELKPPGTWAPELLLKAGEGGSWQSRWDPHPLALDGFGKLLCAIEEAKALDPPLRIVPYVVIRGNPDWNDAEWAQIAECAVASPIVSLNLEPGDSYWNGPVTPEELRWGYLEPMWERIRSAFGPDPAWKKVFLELGAIPRQWVIDELGGDDDEPRRTSTLEMWAKYVRGMAWETYDAVAADLDVAQSMARVYRWLGDTPVAGRLAYHVPIVQRSRISAWAGTGYARGGIQVWHLDGD